MTDLKSKNTDRTNKQSIEHRHINNFKMHHSILRFEQNSIISKIH